MLNIMLRGPCLIQQSPSWQVANQLFKEFTIFYESLTFLAILTTFPMCAEFIPCHHIQRVCYISELSSQLFVSALWVTCSCSFCAFNLQHLSSDVSQTWPTSSCRLLIPNKRVLSWGGSNLPADQEVPAFCAILRLTFFPRARACLGFDPGECSHHHQTIS